MPAASRPRSVSSPATLRRPLPSNLVAKFAQTVNPFTVSATAGVITLTMRNGGLIGNSFDVRVNAGGTVAGEVLPGGVTVSVTPMAGGAVNPTNLATELQNLADFAIEFYCMPYVDAVNLNAMQAFLSESTGRWNPINMLWGAAFSAESGTASALLTAGAARNDPHMSILSTPVFPSWDSVVAAEYTAVCAVSGRADPALPLQFITLNLPAVPVSAQFNYATRNSLLNSGMATIKYAA